MVFVACDHLGIGDSSPVAAEILDADAIVAANELAAREIAARLVAGDVDGRLAGRELRCIGVGQSMGGYLLTLHQARTGFFSAVAMLGWSSIHTAVPAPPTDSAVEAGAGASATGRHPLVAAFHFDDEDPDVVDQDMVDFPERSSPRPR